MKLEVSCRLLARARQGGAPQLPDPENRRLACHRDRFRQARVRAARPAPPPCRRTGCWRYNQGPRLCLPLMFAGSLGPHRSKWPCQGTSVPFRQRLKDIVARRTVLKICGRISA